MIKTSVQEQMPAWHFSRYGRPLQEYDVGQAYCWAERARKQIRRDPEREFEGRGYRIVYQELSFGGVRIRARLNNRTKELFLDPESEAELFAGLDALGFPLEPSPKRLILTHELFHLFCPRCPSGIEELAAHLFVAEELGLDYFPGILDLARRPASLIA
ncbi:MAG: hypothetical protein WC314_09405 [Vulcanimicrobiota bacterium]